MRKVFAVLFLGLLGASCKINSWDTKVQYMPDMADAPTMKAQEDFLNPPEHSIPVNGILYLKTIEEAEKVLTNPYPHNDDTVVKGKKLYNTFCIPCHGESGKGDGSITDVYPRPPDITNDPYKSKGDGFFFYRISFGSALMPSYGHAISPHERWYIIHYLKSLQGKG